MLKPMKRASPLFLALALAGCSRELVLVGDAEQVVPFASPVEGVTPQAANNNLDVVRHDGRVYLAFRTAPTHFASELTELYVVSSPSTGEGAEASWRFEARFAMGTDLREPRFLSYEGRLFLYFAVLGTDPLKFEPQGTMVTELVGDAFTEPAWWEDQPTFIPWRLKVTGGVAYMIGYTGGEAIYELGQPQGQVAIKWLRSSDGLAWEPAAPDVGLGPGTVLVGGGSETDYTLLPDGALVAVARNELGDAEHGWGSKICRAEAGALGAWTCKADPRKFDSPLVFRAGSEVYLVGRRTLEHDGNYDLGMRELSPEDQTSTYLVEYSFAPKVCSLWRVDPASLTVDWLLDLPSRGDTCFASALPLNPGLTVGDPLSGDVAIYNYSSALDGPPEELDWVVAQGQPTLVTRQVLSLP
jgi:hypothetical protein